MSTYLLCPRKYRYAYIEHAYKKQKRVLHVNMIFGKIIHQCCKEFYQLKSSERTLDNLSNLFRRLWKQEAMKRFFENQVDERVMGIRGLEMLKNFYNGLGSQVPYKIEEHMEHKIKDYVLYGRVDRVDLSADGSLQIFDYKTTRYYEHPDSNSSERERGTIQLKLYAYILHSTKHTVTSGSYYHLEENKFDTLQFTPQSIKYIGNWFDEIINDIRYDRIFEKNIGSHCKYCDFYKVCFSEEENLSALEDEDSDLLSYKSKDLE